MNIFAKPKSLGANVKVELDLSNYATQDDLRNATGVGAFAFAKKVCLTRSKSNLNKLNFDKLKIFSTGLSSY